MYSSAQSNPGRPSSPSAGRQIHTVCPLPPPGRPRVVPSCPCPPPPPTRPRQLVPRRERPLAPPRQRPAHPAQPKRPLLRRPRYLDAARGGLAHVRHARIGLLYDVRDRPTRALGVTLQQPASSPGRQG